VVPTAITRHGSNFNVSNLGTFDSDQLNAQSIFQITPSGSLRVIATGFSKVLGLAFDDRSRLYVLETSYSMQSAPSGPKVIPVGNVRRPLVMSITTSCLPFSKTRIRRPVPGSGPGSVERQLRAAADRTGPQILRV
jgi:hypothetical protein